MRTLPIPAIRAESVLLACAHHIRDSDLSDRLTRACGEVTGAEEAYLLKGRLGTIYQTIATTHAGEVHVTEMSKIYDGSLAKRGTAPRRRYYDLIKASAPYRICPFCSHMTVSTLDHYLPKAKHPQLALTPANLIPSCSDCNKWKSTRQGETATDEILHPYFDVVDDDTWLFGNIVPGNPPGMTFYAKPPDGWPNTTKLRVMSHFNALRLGELFSSQAGRLISNIRSRMAELFREDGPSGVREHLKAEARSYRKNGNNIWEVAAFEALSRSDYFCEELPSSEDDWTL